jgi:predicted ester cyclase
MADLQKLGERFNDEVFSQGKLEVIDELVAEDFVEREQTPPGIEANREGIKQFVTMFRTGFPDIKAKTIATGVDGDELWMYSEYTGTNTGEFMGMPATGKKMKVTGFDRVKVKDGKVVEHWGMVDNMSMMTQLGVIPEM